MKLKEIHNVYFIGIGGVGMSALARLCLKEGYSVYGYDKISSEITDQLVKKGIKIILWITQTYLLKAFLLKIWFSLIFLGCAHT